MCQKMRDWFLQWMFFRLLLSFIVSMYHPEDIAVDNNNKIHFLTNDNFKPQHNWDSIVYSYEELIDKGIIVLKKDKVV